MAIHSKLCWVMMIRIGHFCYVLSFCVHWKRKFRCLFNCGLAFVEIKLSFLSYLLSGDEKQLRRRYLLTSTRRRTGCVCVFGCLSAHNRNNLHISQKQVCFFRQVVAKDRLLLELIRNIMIKMENLLDIIRKNVVIIVKEGIVIEMNGSNHHCRKHDGTKWV